jgi:RNA polymerase sigma-70 factor (ECF subfamily)
VSRAERETPLTEFRELFVNEFSWVCRTLRRFGVRSRDVEDAVQEVFVGVHKKFSEYDPERPARPWLAAFAFRVASNQNRLARHRRELLDEAAPEASGELNPEQALEAKQARDLVLSALQNIDLDRRAVLVMHDIDAFKASEISESLGIPLNTVYSRLRVARGELKQAILRVRKQVKA